MHLLAIAFILVRDALFPLLPGNIKRELCFFAVAFRSVKISGHPLWCSLCVEEPDRGHSESEDKSKAEGLQPRHLPFFSPHQITDACHYEPGDCRGQDQAYPMKLRAPGDSVRENEKRDAPNYYAPERSADKRKA
jgi:hypothetical protein